MLQFTRLTLNDVDAKARMYADRPRSWVTDGVGFTGKIDAEALKSVIAPLAPPGAALGLLWRS